MVADATGASTARNPIVGPAPISAVSGTQTSARANSEVFHMTFTPIGAFIAGDTKGLCRWITDCSIHSKYQE